MLRRTQEICHERTHNISVSPRNPAKFLRGPRAHDCEPPNVTLGTLMRQKMIPSFPCDSSFHTGGHAPVHHCLAWPDLTHVVRGHTLHSTGSQTLRERHNTCTGIIFTATAPLTTLQNVSRFEGAPKRDCLTPSSPAAGTAPGLTKPEYGDTITL